VLASVLESFLSAGMGVYSQAGRLLLWKAVGKATGWKVGRCRHVQISELFSMDECDQAVMDFLAATEVGKFPPK
jgi:hypothetical protein